MRVHDKIRPPSSFWKRNVLFIDNESANTFLSMSTRKLIAQFWSPHFSDNGLNDFWRLIVCSDNYAINMEASAGGLKTRRLIIPWDLIAVDTDNFEFILDLFWDDRNFLVDVNVTVLNRMPDFSQSILIKTFIFFHYELIVHVFPSTLSHWFHLLRPAHQIIADPDIIVSLELSFISSEIKSSAKPSVHRCPIHNHCVFDIVPTVRHHCNTCIMASWQFVIVHKLNRSCLCHWLLRIN